MKRILIIFTGWLLTLTAWSQANPVDELFDKYNGKEGFTTVYISSKMFSMFANTESKDEDLNTLVNKLKSIRILTVEDSALNKKINFYNELSKGMDFKAYEELMVVKEANNTTKFLIKEKGKYIEELLVITGGTDGNTLISIRGDLDLKSLSGLSKNLGIQQLQGLEKIEKK